jgi:hypothetical protein
VLTTSDANSGRKAFIKKHSSGEYTSRNLQALVNFARDENITFNANMGALSSRVSPLLEVVQLMLAPLMFDLDAIAYLPIAGFPTSQRVAYLTAESRPIVLGGEFVDFDWVLHQVNFWRHHLLIESECSVFPDYNELNDTEKPRFWTDQLQTQRKPHLGRHWKASFGNMDLTLLPRVREGCRISQVDEFCTAPNGGLIFDVDIKLDIHRKADWNQALEEHIHSFGLPVTDADGSTHTATDTRSHARSIQLEDCTGDGPDSLLIAKGWLHSLPPQEEVPDWQRITFMQYIKDDAGNISTDWICAYEGVVLPGAQMILGRWFVPNDDVSQESGPFIMWNTDAAHEHDQTAVATPESGEGATTQIGA